MVPYIDIIKNYIYCDIDIKLKLFGISDRDLENIKHIKERGILEDILKNFFSFILSFDDLQNFFTERDITHVKKKIEDYLEDIISAKIDNSYINSRVKLAFRHYKNDVPLFHFFSGYSKLINEFFKYSYSSEEKEIFLSLLKLFFLDISIIAQSYLAIEEENKKRVIHKYNSLFHNINDGIIITDVDTMNIVNVNRKIEKWTGFSRNELVSRDISFLFMEETKIKNLLKERLERYPVLYLKTKKDRLIPVELSLNFTIENGKLFSILVARNIKYKLEIEKHIERLRRLYKVLSDTNKLITSIKNIRELFESITDIIVNTGKFNSAAIVEIKKDKKKILSFKSTENISTESFLKENLPYIDKAFILKKTVKNLLENEERIYIPVCEKSPNLIEIKDNCSYILVVSSTEVSLFKEEEIHLLQEIAEDLGFALYSLSKNRHIKFLENFDIVTKLPNRRYFFSTLEKIIKEKKPDQFAVILIDILHFKELNEYISFETGDILLREVSSKLISFFKDNSYLISRVGGDEFGIITKELSKKQVINMVKNFISDINKEIFHIKGKSISVSLNAGISFFPKDGKSSEELLAAAESALEEAKKIGKNICETYNPFIKKELLEKIELERDLKNAILNREFKLFFQPILTLKDRKIVGAEALLRWFSPKRGYMPPLTFIDILEESGLIYDVGLFVIDEALNYLKKLEKEKIYISINISPYQIKRGDLYEIFSQKIKEKGVYPKNIVVEITETTLMENLEVAKEQLKKLKSLGISVAIDDFGTGYSSLAYLKELPFSYVKIDRTFIKDILENESDIKISKAIINLAHSLDKRVIAEGIETEKQIEILKDLDCDYGQGYFFSKPVSDIDFEKLLK